MFAFSQIDPRTTGQVFDMEVPVSRYLGAAGEQGWHDSVFSTLSRMTEYHLEENDPDNQVLSAQGANIAYGIGDLKFDKDTKVGVAKLMHDRKQMEMDRSFYMSQDNHNLAAGIAGMGTQMIASIANPLDFSLMFMPFVGGEKIAASASIMGRGALVRQALARGLVTQETLANLVPRGSGLAGSMINGLMAQTAMEPAKLLEANQTQGKVNPFDALTNIAASGLFAGLFHVGMKGAAHVFSGLTETTKVAMYRKALDDFAKGNDIEVHDYVKLDDAYIEARAKFDEYKARAEAEKAFPSEDPIVSAAIKLADGSIHTGDSHYAIADDTGVLLDGMGDSLPDSGVVPGFVTKSGKFLDRHEADALIGFPHGEGFGMHSSDIDKVTFKREQQIEEFINKQRASHDIEGKRNEIRQRDIQQQLAEGKILPPDLAKKYYQPTGNIEPKDSAIIDEDLKNLEENLKKQSQAEAEWRAEHGFADAKKVEFADHEQALLDAGPEPQPDAIDQAVDCVLKKLL